MITDMYQAFEKPTLWNEFYEKAWTKRQELMSLIIASGETHPLRVINILSSVLRFSDEEVVKVGGTSNKLAFVCDVDSKYVLDDVRNVTIVENNNGINIETIKHLPGGMLADIQLAHRNEYSIACSYTDCDKMEFIADYCRLRNFDAVIELGSGYSQNLVKLFYQGGPKIPYYGGEFTRSGTHCAKMLNDLSDELEIINFRFDFRKADLSIIPKYDNVLVFTSHAIEQVNIIPDDLIPIIANVAKQVTCMHMEPFGFQLTSPDNECEIDKNQRKYFKTNDWNLNLMNQLILHSCNGNIDLQYIGKHMMGGSDFHNPSSIALWKSGHIDN